MYIIGNGDNRWQPTLSSRTYKLTSRKTTPGYIPIEPHSGWDGLLKKPSKFLKYGLLCAASALSLTAITTRQ